MTWRIVWVQGAEDALRRMPWRDAARVDAAVQQLARTGRGSIYRLRDDHADLLRLLVPPYRVRLTLDRFEGVLYVGAVYRLET